MEIIGQSEIGVMVCGLLDKVAQETVNEVATFKSAVEAFTNSFIANRFKDNFSTVCGN